MNAPLTPAAAAARAIELVVVGGSAGAFEVLRVVARHLTAKLAPAVAVVVHMAQDSPPMLHEILGAAGRPPMRVAEDKEPIIPGTLYIAAPGYHLLVEAQRTFALSLDEPEHFSRPAIDVLFESAADAYGARVAGVILSGANTDGAAGLRAIAAAGGMSVVQRPASAQVTTMPDAALLACPHSLVLGVGELAPWLMSLGQHGGAP
jgi:two-component system, chemotaxis family, protein-glutamate methylesterase/glutaminase